MEQYFNYEEFTKHLTGYLPKVVGAVLVLIIGFWIISWILKALKAILERNKVDKTVRPFLISLANVGLKVMLLISAAGLFGVKTTSFIAVFSALVFSVGLALQGSLGHFASGVLILVFKPYQVDDLVKVAGEVGVVKEIQMFNTVLLTPDNKRIIIPNGVVTSGVITNISGQNLIRVDMTFGIGYSDDIDKARQIIQQVADSCSKVLKEKPVDIFVKELADSSVNFAVRPWANSAHYWDVYFYMHENIKKEFDKADIGIPFPQMDIHVSKN